MEPIKKLIKQAATQIDRERDQFAKSLGITGVQMSTLDFISNQEDQIASQHSIEEEFDLRRSTVTIMIQRMEKHDLVRRIPNKNDKRQKLVTLTPKSKQILPKVKQYMINDDQKMRRYFSEDEFAIVKKVLNYVKSGDKYGTK